jgi:phosphatidylglycerol:prolipoprotein diacylglycerol transferase
MLIYPKINPIALTVGNISIHWYGIMYLIAFVLVLVLGRIRIKKQKTLEWSISQLDDVLWYGMIGVIIGGRLGYVLFYKFSYYLLHPIEIFYIWQGGMSFHGGFLGVAFAIWLFSNKVQKKWLEVTDFIVPLVPLGLGAGRIGNFINGELWGRPTDLPWSMIFPKVDSLTRHPSQLYEFILEGLVLFVIIWIYSSRNRPIGAISGLFLVGYGFFRFLVEFSREPDDFLGLLTLGLSMGQWLSLPMMVIGVLMIFLAYHNKPIQYNQKN